MHYTFFSFAKDGKHSFDTIIVKLYFYLKISAAISNFQHRSLSEFDMGYPVTHRIIQAVCLHNLKLIRIESLRLKCFLCFLIRCILWWCLHLGSRRYNALLTKEFWRNLPNKT